jgi:hypothetical protein
VEAKKVVGQGEIDAHAAKAGTAKATDKGVTAKDGGGARRVKEEKRLQNSPNFRTPLFSLRSGVFLSLHLL